MICLIIIKLIKKTLNEELHGLQRNFHLRDFARKRGTMNVVLDHIKSIYHG